MLVAASRSKMTRIGSGTVFRNARYHVGKFEPSPQPLAKFRYLACQTPQGDRTPQIIRRNAGSHTNSNDNCYFTSMMFSIFQERSKKGFVGEYQRK